MKKDKRPDTEKKRVEKCGTTQQNVTHSLSLGDFILPTHLLCTEEM